jgi:hypothetical protein
MPAAPSSQLVGRHGRWLSQALEQFVGGRAGRARGARSQEDHFPGLHRFTALSATVVRSLPGLEAPSVKPTV